MSEHPKDYMFPKNRNDELIQDADEIKRIRALNWDFMKASTLSVKDPSKRDPQVLPDNRYTPKPQSNAFDDMIVPALNQESNPALKDTKDQEKYLMEAKELDPETREMA